MRRRALAIVRMVLVCALMVGTAQAQMGLLAIEFAGKTLRQILGDADAKANNLLKNARLQSNLAFADGGNQLQVLTKNIQSVLSSELDKRFEELSNDERNLLAGLNDIIKSANEQTGKMERIADFVSMDVDKYLQRLPGAEKRPFYIRRVENVVLRHQKLPYIIKVRGMGFGQQPARSFGCGSRRS